VIRLTSRATILLSFDGNHIRIPNAIVFKSRIVNFSRNAERRFTFELGVAPEADLARAQSLGQSTLEALPFVLATPQASVWVESVGDSWVSMGLAAWISQNDTSIVLARSEAIRMVLAAYDAAGLSAPPPTYRLLHEGGTPPPSMAEKRAQPVVQGPDTPPPPVQDVNALEDKQLTRIIDLERAGEHDDLLRKNGDQE
jgi:small conductance mechanosensitive channel